MLFRLTDEQEWEHRFEASAPDELKAGIREAWDAYINEHRHPKAPKSHPAFAYQWRLSEIDRWLDERLSRPGATEDAKRSWRAQAAQWRWTAKRDHGGWP